MATLPIREGNYELDSTGDNKYPWTVYKIADQQSAILASKDGKHISFKGRLFTNKAEALEYMRITNKYPSPLEAA